MKQELSILIPVFNYDCTSLIDGLCLQASALEQKGVQIEIVIAEDGSADASALQANAALASKPYCRYIVRQENVGRAAIRNFLAQESRYTWLLFLDCDMQLPHSHFLADYLDSSGTEVVDGGFGVTENRQLMGRNLRYTYEYCSQKRHSLQERTKNPYRSFRTTNFMIRRDIMLRYPFDERFRHYGYEDVLFGKVLKKNGIGISHIDNPMMLTDVETNAVFVAKTEESLHTLHQFRSDLLGFSRLLTAVENINSRFTKGMLRMVHRLFGRLERRWLCGRHPNLKVFNLYKIGYYLELEKQNR